MVNIATQLTHLWNSSRTLTATGILMVAALAAFSAGLILDPRTVGGAPVWLKPAKFAVSTAVFAVTVAWVFRYLTVWRPLMRAAGWILSAALVIEVVVIALQAARGVNSHFNVATAFDAAMFAIMGVAIAALWLTSVLVLVALLRQPFHDRAWGWWLRLGMLITVLGSGAGGAMLRMTPEQAEARRVGRRLHMIGGHTVGAADGGPGLPVTGWSTRSGDLRIPHFLGLHAIQILPLIGWRLRRQPARVQVRLAFVAASSYAALTGILCWQALIGESVVQPDATMLTALGLWLAGTAVGAGLARSPFATPHAAAAARS